MDHTRVYKLGNGPYYRNHFMQSANGRQQIIGDRLNGRGISTSSNSSWNFSNSYLDIPKSRKGKLWGAFLMGVILIVVLVVSAVAGLAFYMGVIRTDLEKEMLIFDGSLRIMYGDQYQSNLKNTSSKAFHEKATKYSSMLTSILQNSIIGTSLQTITILRFEKGSLIVHFRIQLDRRKIPDSVPLIEEFLKKTIMEEINSTESEAFKNLEIDKRNVKIKRFLGEEFTTFYKTINRTKEHRPIKKTDRKNEAKKSTTTTTTTFTPTLTPTQFEPTKQSKPFKNQTQIFLPTPAPTLSEEESLNYTKLHQSINEIFQGPTMNGHARPVTASTTTSTGYILLEEPWKPILPTPVDTIEPEITTKISKKTFEEDVKIVPEIKEEIITTTVQPKELVGVDQMISGIKEMGSPTVPEISTIAVITPTSLHTVKNPFMDNENSRSSNIMKFGIPDLPIIQQFHNLDELFHSFPKPAPHGIPPGIPPPHIIPLIPTENVIHNTPMVTRFPMRTKINMDKNYRDFDNGPIYISTIPVETMTTEGTKIITLLPVRSNVNMRRPLRPKPIPMNRVKKVVRPKKLIHGIGPNSPSKLVMELETDEDYGEVEVTGMPEVEMMKTGDEIETTTVMEVTTEVNSQAALN